MTKEDTFNFLLRAAIPEIEDFNKLPEDLQWEPRERRRKEQEPGYFSKKLIWECVYRAHRDVLTGRKFVKNYAKSAAQKLYSEIINPQNTKELSSEELIDYIVSAGYGIGPTQKLVNMTLKYMFLLQLFGKLKGYSIKEEDCDCPLDSIILESLGMGDAKWTKDFEASDGKTKKSYKEIQEKIKELQGSKSKLSYDFEHWKPYK